MIKKTNFGSLDGKEVYLYELEGKGGLKAEITNYGGIIRKIEFRGTDVVLGRDTLDEYLKNDGYFGALIGRNSNRIANAAFELNGETYTLYKNDGNNNLHGGKTGYNARVWDSETIDGDEPKLILTLQSPDGEEGFPGNAEVKVTYTITSDNGVSIHYEAAADADTVVNMTNHSYFNLNGHNGGVIDGHTLEMMCDFFTPNNDECMPTGEVVKVDGTVFDLRTPKRMSEVFASDDEQIKMFGGFDHNFCIRGFGLRRAAVLCGDKSGIKMEVYTDLPGVQIYSGNGIKSGRVCKDGAVYEPHHGICLETQTFPNGVNYSHFPSPVLKKGGKYDTTTIYKFM